MHFARPNYLAQRGKGREGSQRKSAIGRTKLETQGREKSAISDQSYGIAKSSDNDTEIARLSLKDVVEIDRDSLKTFTQSAGSSSLCATLRPWRLCVRTKLCSVTARFFV